MEPLAAQARMGLHYWGLQVRGHIHHIALYADDLLMFLTDMEDALRGAKTLLAELGALAGLNVNWAKTCFSCNVYD